MVKQQNTPIEEHKTFVQEVDDALRQEKLLALWHAYKYVIIGGIVLLFVFVAAQEWYGNYSYERSQKQVNAYVDAVDSDSVDAYKKLAETQTPYATLAAVEAAKKALDNGQKEDAAKLYEAVALNKSVPQYIRDLGHYYAALAYMDFDVNAAEKHITELTGGEGAFQLSALELQALLYIQKGEKATAATFLERIILDTNAPVSLKQRAQQTLANLETLS